MGAFFRCTHTYVDAPGRADAPGGGHAGYSRNHRNGSRPSRSVTQHRHVFGSLLFVAVVPGCIAVAAGALIAGQGRRLSGPGYDLVIGLNCNHLTVQFTQAT